VRLVTFVRDGAAVPGLRDGDSIVDLSRAAPELAGDWAGILAAGALQEAQARAAAAGPEARRPAAGLTWLPPIPRPPKILCIGLNYRSHAEELGMAIPEHPIVFARWPASLVGHEAPLVRPKASQQFDYEAELAAVIGIGGRFISRARALDHVAGYAVFNDGSLRDIQFQTSQWTLGKNFDASGAFGPEIVTADELPPGAAGLAVRCRLNGETVQDGNTDDLIFDVAQLIEEISAVMTLEPGDVIATGTPPGVGVGRRPQLFMKPGDLCEMEIEGIGILRNPVIAEADA